jgi:precorrin-6Y C5,15-methyltransferase (decarboxylating)
VTIVVVGVGADGWAGLAEPARAELTSCDVLFGSSRQLALIPLETPKEAWPSPLLPALDDLLSGHEGRRFGVLASGDPLLSGIGTTLVKRFGDVRIVPGVSSVTLARARLGWSAEETEVVSVVGRNVHRVARLLTPGARLLVLSSAASSPAEIAELLTAQGFGDSSLTVFEQLGSAAERRVEGVARTWSAEVDPLNIVAVECAGGPGLPALPGLPDDAFEHDGQLTKRDLRALALARLAPLPGQLLWDVGAGAGSVAIEWSRAHPSNRAIAVERDPARAARIGRNAERLGVPDLRVVTGSAPSALADLPAPDAVFLGGGLSSWRRCWDALAPGGRLVAHAVTLESEQTLAAAYAECGGELARVAIEHTAPLGGFTGWTPARTVTQWSVSR